MMKLKIVWDDTDGTTTLHEFEALGAAEPWLLDVLQDEVPVEVLEEDGYGLTGFGMLNCYRARGFDSVGTFRVLIDEEAVDFI